MIGRKAISRAGRGSIVRQWCKGQHGVNGATQGSETVQHGARTHRWATRAASRSEAVSKSQIAGGNYIPNGMLCRHG